MYRYIGMPVDFRLAAWPYSPGRYVTTYNTDRYTVDVRMILDYLEFALRKVKVAFVLKTTFTLINVYDDLTQTSVGVHIDPDPSVYRTRLAFTFARTRRNEFGKPVHKFWQNNYICTWGDANTAINDFITISIPVNIIAKARIPNMMLNEQRRLHDIVGGYTKSIIRSRHKYNGSVSSTRNFKYYTIPRAMQYLAMDDWKYVLDFWKRMPDLLHVEWTPKFIEYYCRYIAADLPDRKRSKYYEQYDDEAKEHLRQFVLRYLQNTVKSEEANLVALLPADDLLINDVETLVTNLAKGIIT